MIGAGLAAALAVWAPARAQVKLAGTDMTFQLMRASAPECGENCPEWIAAQGTIQPGTAKVFAAFLARLDARRRPVLIDSPGGSVSDGMEMGRLIRARKLAVAVAKTRIDAYTPGEPTRPATGVADSLRGFCMSSCSLVLAGGVERFANPMAGVGVHEIKETLNRTMIHRQYLVHYRLVGGRKIETSRDLVSESKDTTTSIVIAPSDVNARIGAYFKEMGETPALLDLFATATPDKIHRMTAQEEKDTGLVTAWLYGIDPIWTAPSANGLQGAPADPARGDQAALSARGVWPISAVPDGDLGKLTLTLALRRGGGGVTATLMLEEAEGAHLRYGFIPGAPLAGRQLGADGRRATLFLPNATFCAYARDALVHVSWPRRPPTQSAGLPDPRARLVEAPLASVPGMSALTDEVCAATTARK